MNTTAVLKGFLEDAKEVVVRNGLVGNGTGATCPKMTVLFARGTAEPGIILPS